MFIVAVVVVTAVAIVVLVLVGIHVGGVVVFVVAVGSDLGLSGRCGVASRGFGKPCMTVRLQL